jgi:hypothetical protein
MLWNRWNGSTDKCCYFIGVQLLCLGLDALLHGSKLTRKRVRGGQEGFNEKGTFAAIVCKFILQTIAFKIRYSEISTVALYVARDAFVLGLLYVSIWSYLKTIPPTISETFTNNYKGVVFGGIVPFSNLMVILYKFANDANVPGKVLMGPDFHDLFMKLLWYCLADLGFILLIFFLDTNTREEKVNEINSKNHWHMAVLFVYMLLKFFGNSAMWNIHMLPHAIPFIYFNYLNYDLNHLYNSTLQLKPQKDPKWLYDNQLIHNVLSLSYEVLFLLSFMSYYPD